MNIAIGDTWATAASKLRNFEMGYKREAVAALVLACLLAAHTGVADEIVVTESANAANPAEGMNRELLKQANAAAAKKAIEAVLADTKLDLDIRLIGPTSIKIAADR